MLMEVAAEAASYQQCGRSSSDMFLQGDQMMLGKWGCLHGQSRHLCQRTLMQQCNHLYLCALHHLRCCGIVGRHTDKHLTLDMTS